MKYLVVCVGNRDGGDDAVGPYIADQLNKKQGKIADGIDVLDVGVVPENYTGVIKKKNPDVLILIDAVDMQLNPGDIRLIPPGHIGVMHISTHGIPLSVYISYLSNHISTIKLIGIQPRNMDGEISEEVLTAADRLILQILESRLDEIKEFET